MQATQPQGSGVMFEAGAVSSLPQPLTLSWFSQAKSSLHEEPHACFPQ